MILRILFLITLSGCSMVMHHEPLPSYYVVFPNDSTILYRSDWKLSGQLATIHKNDTLEISGKSYFFYKVKIHNLTGWLFMEDLQPEEFTDQPLNLSDTSSFSTDKKNPTRYIQTGPKGGKYYINGNGKKTYIEKK